MYKGKTDKIFSNEKKSHMNASEDYSDILNYFKADLKEEKFLKELTTNTKPKILKNAFNYINYKKPVDVVKEVYSKASLTERLRNLDSEIDVVKLRESNENNFSTINSWRSVSYKSKENQFRTTNSQKLFKKDDFFSHFNKSMDFLKNFLTNLKNHKEISEKMKKILSCDLSMVNSENKQIKYFVLVLDSFHSLNFKDLTGLFPNEGNLEDLKTKFNTAKISLIDSLFWDFCTHLSISSNFRSEFLQRVWKAKTFYTEKSFSKKNNEIEDLKNKFEILGKNLINTQSKLKISEEKSSQLSEIILKLQKEIRELNKQLDQSENKIREISSKYSLITRQNEIKDNMLKEMLEKVNYRKNRIESSIHNKMPKEATNYSDTKFSLANMNERESARPSCERNIDDTISYSNSPGKNAYLKRHSTYSQVSPFDNGSLNVSNFLDFNHKDLIYRKENFSQKSLKLKFLQKNSNSNIFQFRKHMIVDQSVIKMNSHKSDVDNIDKAKRQLDLQHYLNKGIEIVPTKLMTKGVQTENSHHEIAIEIDKKLVEKKINFEVGAKNMKNSFINLTEILERLKKNLPQNKYDHNEVEYYFQVCFDNIKKTSQLVDIEISQNYSDVLNDLNFISSENKKTRNLFNKLAEEQNEKEKVQRDIFDVMQKIISESNSNLLNTAKEMENDILLDNTNKILTSINKIIEQNKLSLVHPNIKSKIHANSIINPDQNQPSIFNSGHQLLNEFLSNENEHPYTFNQKKCLKIIDNIYFNMIGDVYFKHINNHLDSESFSFSEFEFNTINFRELPYNFFCNRYLLESLSNTKFLEFLKSLSVNRSFHKRIDLFYKLLIQCEFEEQNMKNERRYDTCVLKYVILLINFIKVENCLYNEEENLSTDTDKKILLIFHKISNLVSTIFDKFQIFSGLLPKILNFLEKNKFKHREKLILVDFDDFLQFYVDLLSNFLEKYRKYLRIIFKSIDLEEKNNLGFLDFVIAQDALYFSNKRLEKIKTMFDSKSNENLMQFEAFEALILENDNDLSQFNVEMFRDYCNINELELETSILSLKEDLEGTSVSVFDIIFKRLSVLRNRNNPSEIILIRKIEILKDSIVDYEKRNLWIIWISLKIMEKLSEVIYNEAKLSNYFQNLSCAYEILSNNSEKNPIIIEYLDLK